jgi:tRNA-specific 2-thiouridylase
VVEPIGEDGARVAFRNPQPAVAPGQALAIYAGDEVLGGGTIVSALR